MPMRRMEDKIRRLSGRLLASKDDKELRLILVELRDALHQHIERIRARFAGYPLVVERRVRNGIPPPDIPTPENAAKETGPAAP